MDSARPVQSSFTYNVLVVALIGVIATGAALLFLTTGSPRAGAQFELGTGEAVDCPFGTGSPVCYRFNLTNTGGAEGYVRCLVVPAGDSAAIFANGETAYESPVAVESGEIYRLYVEVDPGPSKDIAEPSISCAPAV
jgi:hypothetical protein